MSPHAVLALPGFAKGMFNVISCGTMSFTFMVDIQGDKMQFNNMKVFGFAPISPCPLIPYCGFGPFANVPKFEKDPSTGKWCDSTLPSPFPLFVHCEEIALAHQPVYSTNDWRALPLPRMWQGWHG